MASVKERLAILRARRTKNLHSTKAELTSNVLRDPFLAEQSITHVTPSLSSITRQLASDSDDEDLDEDEEIQLVILPPTSLTPSKKSRGARLTWRQKEQKRAREKSKQFLEDMGDYEAMTIPVEPVEKPDVTASDTKEEDDDGVDDEDLDEDEEDEPDIDDEERALQGAAHEDEYALELAEQDDDDNTGELVEDNGSVHTAPDEKPTAESERRKETIGPKDGNQNKIASNAMTNCSTEQKSDEEQPQTVDEINGCLNDSMVANEKTIDTQEDKNISNEAPTTPPAAPMTCEVSESPENEPEGNNNTKDQAQLKPRASHPTITDTCEFFEDEAEEDPAEEDLFGSPKEVEDEMTTQHLEGADIGIVQDSTPNVKDGKKLAKFHRQWELQQDFAEIKAAVTGPSAMDDEDQDEAQLGQSKQAETSRGTVEQEQNSTSGSQVNASKDSEAADTKDKYMDTMFLKDDSNSKFFEEDADDDEDEKITRMSRMKARALWRVRQKTKMKLREDDGASLSRFSLLIDSESSRSEAIRAKLESSCRPARTERGGTGELENGQKDDRLLGKRRTQSHLPDDQPTWAKRQACLDKKNEKRKHAVAVGKWSFSCHGDKVKTNNPKPKSSSASIGPSFTACKDRSKSGSVRSRPIVKPKPPRSKRSQQAPTNFKGLLSLLGQQAQTDA